jgi:hypothetical protein
VTSVFSFLTFVFAVPLAKAYSWKLEADSLEFACPSTSSSKMEL